MVHLGELSMVLSLFSLQLQLLFVEATAGRLPFPLLLENGTPISSLYWEDSALGRGPVISLSQLWELQ